MKQESVKVRIRFKPDDDLPAGECMWARPLVANDGGGTFELRNTSFHVPLAVRDVVRAELDGDGLLQVTDIVCPGPMVMSWARCRSVDEVAAIGDGWLERGANWSEGAPPMLATVWEDGVGAAQVREVLDADVAAGRLVWARVIEPDARTADHQELIDFELDREQHVPEVTTTYWAADDPYWRAHGLDHPDFLAYIQTLAGADATVADALEAGDHEAVREMVAFLNDGPLW